MTSNSTTITDNSQIEKFYGECQKMISNWNEENPAGNVGLMATLGNFRNTDGELSIRFEAEPKSSNLDDIGKVTLFDIWFDYEKYIFFGTLPSLPFLEVVTTIPVTLDKLHDWLEDFNL
ncbi:MAG: hypothetical protein ACK42D_03505 [Candidatus Paceibacteria bacterium]